MKHFLAPYVGQEICPLIQRRRPACQLRPMSSLFLLDVYGRTLLYLLSLDRSIFEASFWDMDA